MVACKTVGQLRERNDKRRERVCAHRSKGGRRGQKERERYAAVSGEAMLRCAVL